METFRLSEIVGLPVIVLDAGENVGKVKDLIFDLADKKLLALVFKPGRLGFSKAVPFDDIEKIGKDAVSVKSKKGFVKPKTFTSDHIVLGSKLMGSKAFCENGEMLGTLKELIICIDDGSIAEVETSRSWLDVISRGHTVFPGSAIKSAGNDTVVLMNEVKDEARQTGGVKEIFQAVASKSTKLVKGADSALASKEGKYALGKISSKTVKGTEDKIIVAKNQRIEEEHISQAKDQGKLHELALAAGLSSMKEKWDKLKEEN
ncbi:PRC-barrel domain-containing protein [Candidatus Oleimmundimicrobium sp.]|uniref:PRC-barrel domain-containing protein n=1 Tax=Candidatus Oleimmundimicrobium sp. TaxID=3060597 RepID=UPI00272522B9|nr:PRC-barrel domain-containing protein [Candidatus Oleimmundimicrobium sp.]MDO8886852.1 PRC-barrel domain-containing protein [Candidatus Oleimmundimicrobium sp.]